MFQEFVCKTCGESMSGDGYSVVFHCPNADTSLGYEPDAPPLYCTESVDDNEHHE